MTDQILAGRNAVQVSLVVLQRGDKAAEGRFLIFGAEYLVGTEAFRGRLGLEETVARIRRRLIFEFALHLGLLLREVRADREKYGKRIFAAAVNREANHRGCAL